MNINFLKWLIKPFISLWTMRINLILGKGKNNYKITEEIINDVDKKNKEKINLW